MRVFHADRFSIPLPDGHRFPLATYPRLRERVASEVSGVTLHEAPGVTDADLTRAHTQDYGARVTSGRLSDSPPWSHY